MEFSIYNPDHKKQLAAALQSQAAGAVFMCIGTDKVFADSLGPRVGSLLNGQMNAPLFVYGMCNQNITAENLLACHAFIKSMHPQNKIVVIDAAVGVAQQIGNVQLVQGGIVPGAATNKNLPHVGDVGIVGIVADKGMTDFYTLSSEKQQLVNCVAAFIADAILASQNLSNNCAL